MRTPAKQPGRLPTLALAVAASITIVGEVAAQTTFSACYVPDVGAVYMIKLEGLPTACLGAAHVEFSWTEGEAVGDGTVTTAKLADHAVTEPKLAPDAVTSAHVLDGTLAGADLAAGAVGTDQLADGAVATPTVAAGAITTDKLANDAVTGAKLAPGAVPMLARNRVSSVFVTIPTSGCSNVGGLSVTLDAPVDGTVLVNTRTILAIDHSNGTDTQINTYVGLSDTDCPGIWGESSVNLLPSELPSVNDWFIVTTASRTVDVSAGTHTFYLNTQQFRGGSSNLFAHGGIEAVFVTEHATSASAFTVSSSPSGVPDGL